MTNNKTKDIVSTLEALDVLIESQTEKLKLLLTLKDKLTNTDELSIKDIIDYVSLNVNPPPSNDQDNNDMNMNAVMLPLANIAANYSLVDCRIIMQTLGFKAPIRKNHEMFAQFISTIDTNGVMRWYTYTGEEISSTRYQLPMWNEISQVFYEGSSPSAPLLVISYRNGSTIFLSPEIKRDGLIVAGRGAKQPSSSKSSSSLMGMFSMFTSIRTPVDRRRAKYNSRNAQNQSQTQSQASAPSISRSNSRNRNSVVIDIEPSFEVKVIPSIELQYNTKDHKKMLVQKLTALTVPVSNSSDLCTGAAEDGMGACLSGFGNNDTSSKPIPAPVFVSAVNVFFDVNKKSHRIFLGDSSGYLTHVDRFGNLKYRMLIQEGVPIALLAKSAQLLAVVVEDTVNVHTNSSSTNSISNSSIIHLVQVMHFNKLQQTCITEGRVQDIKFDILHPGRLFVALHTGETAVYNTRSKGLSSSKAKEYCKLLAYIPNPNPNANGNEESNQSEGESYHLTMMKGYHMLSSNHAIHAYNFSHSDREFVDMSLVGTKSWDSNSSSNLFVDVTPQVVRVRHSRRVPEFHEDAVTIAAFNTDNNSCVVEIYQNQLTYHDQMSSNENWDFFSMRSPIIMTVLGAVLIYNLWQTMNKKNKELRKSKSNSPKSSISPRSKSFNSNSNSPKLFSQVYSNNSKNFKRGLESVAEEDEFQEFRDGKSVGKNARNVDFSEEEDSDDSANGGSHSRFIEKIKRNTGTNINVARTKLSSSATSADEDIDLDEIKDIAKSLSDLKHLTHDQLKQLSKTIYDEEE